MEYNSNSQRRTSEPVEGVPEKNKLKAEVQERVESYHQELIELSLRIHDNPEIGFRERKASMWLCEFLGRNNFRVEKGISGLATAFRGSVGKGKPIIALLAEYDALPGIGHGCGHNIIAASAVGAAAASKFITDNLKGTIQVLGTPGEEILGGKITMIEAKAFGSVDIAMLVHPGVRNMVITQALACISLEVEFFGKPAHAAAHPEQGINALEAMILSFTNINSLRQHIKESARIHGIITNGGEVANIVPSYSAARFLVRAKDNTYLEELKEKVLNCFNAASLATGARLKYNWGKRVYAPMKTNSVLAQLFSRNLESLGRKIEPFEPRFGLGSTDMGNISQVVPSIHPSIAIASPEVSTHSPEFAQAAASEAGNKGLLDAAKALGMTIADLLSEPKILIKIKREFS